MTDKVYKASSVNGHPGVLITFEGGDGAGKSTQIRFLADILRACGYDVVCIREPGGTRIGEKLRDVLLDNENSEMTPEAELLLYEACRAQLIDEVIRPALEVGAIVLCDRFTDSTLAYQGYGRSLDLDFISRASDFATRGVKADATIMVTCADRQEKRARVDRREDADRLEKAGDDFHTRVLEAFADIAEKNPDRIRIIETSGKHSQTASSVFDVLSDVLPFLTDGTYDFAEVLEAYDNVHSYSKHEAARDPEVAAAREKAQSELEDALRAATQGRDA